MGFLAKLATVVGTIGGLLSAIATILVAIPQNRDALFDLLGIQSKQAWVDVTSEKGDFRTRCGHLILIEDPLTLIGGYTFPTGATFTPQATAPTDLQWLFTANHKFTVKSTDRGHLIISEVPNSPIRAQVFERC